MLTRDERVKALWGADTDTREVWKRRKYGCVRESAERAWSTGREPGLGTRDRCGTAVGPRSNGAVWSGLVRQEFSMRHGTTSWRTLVLIALAGVATVTAVVPAAPGILNRRCGRYLWRCV